MVNRKETEFGEAVKQLFASRDVPVPSVAVMDLGVSTSHAYNILRGDRSASPEFVRAMATAVQATPKETLKLNIAAARDAGFNLDLPEDW